MLPTLDTGMTFQELIVRVAEAAGVADYSSGGVAAVPSSASSLDLCKRMVNDGYQKFISGARTQNKKTYTGWTFLKPLTTITLAPDGAGPLNIDASPSRYRIPIPVVANPQEWTISETTSSFSTTANVTGIDRVWSMLASNVTTGRPVLAALAPVLPKVPGEAPGWEVVFWPKPDKAYQATARFRLQPRRMVALEERHVAGAEHDQTIIAMSIAAMKVRNKSEDAAGAVAEADMFMDASIAMDLQRVPATAGPMRDPSVEDGTLTPDSRYLLKRLPVAGP